MRVLSHRDSRLNAQENARQERRGKYLTRHASPDRQMTISTIVHSDNTKTTANK